MSCIPAPSRGSPGAGTRSPCRPVSRRTAPSSAPPLFLPPASRLRPSSRPQCRSARRSPGSRDRRAGRRSPGSAGSSLQLRGSPSRAVRSAKNRSLSRLGLKTVAAELVLEPLLQHLPPVLPFIGGVLHPSREIHALISDAVKFPIQMHPGDPSTARRVEAKMFSIGKTAAYSSHITARLTSGMERLSSTDTEAASTNVAEQRRRRRSGIPPAGRRSSGQRRPRQAR